MKKRIFASLLAMVMAFSLLPASALAANNWVTKKPSGSVVSVYGTTTTYGTESQAIKSGPLYRSKWYQQVSAKTDTNNESYKIPPVSDLFTLNDGWKLAYVSVAANSSSAKKQPGETFLLSSSGGSMVYYFEKATPAPSKDPEVTFKLLYVDQDLFYESSRYGEEVKVNFKCQNSGCTGTEASHSMKISDVTALGVNNLSSKVKSGYTLIGWMKGITESKYQVTEYNKGFNQTGTTTIKTGDNDVIYLIAQKNEPQPQPTEWDKLTVTKTASASGTVNPGDEITYTITVTNSTGKDLTNVQVTDKLPDALTFVSASPEGQYVADTGLWTIPSLAAGATATLTITAKVKDNAAAGTISNTATITGAKSDDDELDGNGNTDTSDVTVKEPEHDPEPDENKLKDAIPSTDVSVQCETNSTSHASGTLNRLNLSVSLKYNYSITENTATVTITNAEEIAEAFGNLYEVPHTYKEDGSNLTFTLVWGKDDTTGEWDWHLTGDSPLINTVCEIMPEEYTVHYDLNGGKAASGVVYDDVTVSAGEKITVKAAPTRSGYTFKGWKAGETIYQPDAKLTVNSDITFTAQWSKKSSSSDDDDDDYTLRYVTNGGKAISSESKSRSWVKDYEDLPVPTRVGYRFNGWYYDTKLTKAVTGDVQVSSRTVTLYAGWTENSVPAILNGDDHFAYIQGYDDGTVRPNTPVTRAQVATILFRLLDEDVRDEYLTETNTFTDVAADYWANTAISTMANLGVFKGRTADRFDPNAPITRGEFAAVCARFDDSSVQSSNAFSDIDGYWAKQEILRAAALGWVQGYQDGTFRPTASITRAQVVTMINRVLCRQPETASDLLKGMTTFTDCAEGDWCYLAIQEAANSHDYVGKSGSIYESWTDLNKSADWSKYEH